MRNREIGWDSKTNLLWQISRQVDQLTSVFSKVKLSPPVPPPPVIHTLSLTFDNISNADLLVGDSSNVSDWNTFFDLPAYGNSFTSVDVAGNAVNLRGGSNITIKKGLFGDSSQSNNLLEVFDTGCIVECQDICFAACDNLLNVTMLELVVIGGSCFDSCINLVSVNFPKLTTITTSPEIGGYNFSYCYNLSIVNMPLVYTISDFCFVDCESITAFDFPNLVNIGLGVFYRCYSLTNLAIISCVNLGPTTGDDYMFTDIVGQIITLTIPADLMTCNAGAPDGDIQYLVANNNVTIITV